MANLTVPQLIKLLLGIFVVVVVVVGIYLFFSGTVIDFFNNLMGGEEEGEYGGAGISGEIDEEEVRVISFEYGSKTYTVISPTRIERGDGRYYTLDENGWMYHGPSSEEEGYVTFVTERSQESYDRWIGLVNDAISDFLEQSSGEDEIEGEYTFGTCEYCEADGDCTRNECNSIRRECDFVWVVFGENKCVTKIVEPPRSCGDCARGACSEGECLRISEESSEFNCRYVLRDSFFGESVCEYVNPNQPSRVCSDCQRDEIWSPFCTENRCRDISNELEEFGMRCEFNRARAFSKSECVTINN